MSQVSFSPNNANRPAPRWWRKLENVLLMMIIPSVVAIILAWGHADKIYEARLLVMLNTGVVALIKSIGYMLSNGEEYIKREDQINNQPPTQAPL